MTYDQWKCREDDSNMPKPEPSSGHRTRIRPHRASCGIFEVCCSCGWSQSVETHEQAVRVAALHAMAPERDVIETEP